MPSAEFGPVIVKFGVGEAVRTIVLGVNGPGTWAGRGVCNVGASVLGGSSATMWSARNLTPGTFFFVDSLSETLQRFAQAFLQGC